jgi:transcription elongation factor Elf1
VQLLSTPDHRDMSMEADEKVQSKEGPQCPHCREKLEVTIRPRQGKNTSICKNCGGMVNTATRSFPPRLEAK